jgi:hypothetical protein
MMKKNLQSVTASLGDLAATMPTQRPLSVVQHGSEPGEPPVRAQVAPAVPSEPLVQFSFGLRRSLRKELDQLALANDTTMRAFVLSALKEKGLSGVTDADLLDLRKQRAD